MLSLALALAALTAPDVALDKPPCPLPTMQSVAVALEIMDDSERSYMLAHPDYFVANLQAMRDRWVELADAPPAFDAGRFPDCELCSEMCSFNWQYRDQLRDSWDLWREDWILEAIAETEAAYKVWDLARDASCGRYYVTVRRRALKELRELIGADAYYAGCLPPHVPAWRFFIID